METTEIEQKRLRERRRWITEEGKPRSVTCPTCGAPPGMDCHSEAWNKVAAHVARKRAVGL